MQGKEGQRSNEERICAVAAFCWADHSSDGLGNKEITEL